MNITSVVYELPFGKGRKFGSQWSGVFDAVAGGWAINTINSANTGIPLDVQLHSRRRRTTSPAASRTIAARPSCGPM